MLAYLCRDCSEHFPKHSKSKQAKEKIGRGFCYPAQWKSAGFWIPYTGNKTGSCFIDGPPANNKVRFQRNRWRTCNRYTCRLQDCIHG